MSIERSTQNSQGKPRTRTCKPEDHIRELAEYNNEDRKGIRYREKLYATSEIGRGGFGTVYKGHKCIERDDKWTCIIKEPLAIKVLDSPTESGSAYKYSKGSRRAQMECDAHKYLKNIECVVTPKMLPTKISQNHPTILVMEYCDHGDLNNYMKKSSKKDLREPNEFLAKKLVKSVVKGLQALYEQNFFHRDVKASNVFVTGSIEDPTFKLGDFGLVAKLGERNRDVCGTPTAMAPEMDGKQVYSEKVDIWSLGILMYSKLIGRQPYAFDAKADTQTRIKAITQPLSLNDAPISDNAKDLLSLMLQKNPDHRIDLRGIENHPFLRNDPSRQIAAGTTTSDSGFVTSSTLLSGYDHHYNLAPSTRTKFAPLHELPETSHRAHAISLSSIQPRGSIIANSCLSRAGVIKPALFNTQRLKSMSHSVKSSKTTKGKILPDGSLRLEIRRGKPNLHHVETMDYEEFCVSGDGKDISIQRGQDPPKKYSYDVLPDKHWNKYHHASVFVNNLKERTAKITRHFKGGYWKLYENLPDPNFELHFYQCEMRYTYQASKDTLKITRNKEPYKEFCPAYSRKIVDPSQPQLVNEQIKFFWKEREKAQRITKFFQQEEDIDTQYPIVLGKRPTSSSR